MLGQDGALEFKPGFYVICIPTIWKAESGGDICLHVAKQLFGDKAEIYDASPDVYHEAFSALQKVCEGAGRKFDVIDTKNNTVHIGGKTWAEAGLRWARIVKVEEC